MDKQYRIRVIEDAMGYVEAHRMDLALRGEIPPQVKMTREDLERIAGKYLAIRDTEASEEEILDLLVKDFALRQMKGGVPG